jgi:hypothetical protein
MGFIRPLSKTYEIPRKRGQTDLGKASAFAKANGGQGRPKSWHMASPKT